MTEAWVLTEDEALEIVAFLVSAARLLLDEPVDYGPMRLLSAAQRLCAAATPRTAGPTRALLEAFDTQIPIWMRERLRNPEGYTAFLDDLGARIARELAGRAGREVQG